MSDMPFPRSDQDHPRGDLAKGGETDMSDKTVQMLPSFPKPPPTRHK